MNQMFQRGDDLNLLDDHPTIKRINSVTPCPELLKLDQVCMKWLQRTNSIESCIKLAVITGNVTCLYKAIVLLLDPQAEPVAAGLLLGLEPQQQTKPPFDFQREYQDLDQKVDYEILKSQVSINNTTVMYGNDDRLTLHKPMLTVIEWPQQDQEIQLKLSSMNQGFLSVLANLEADYLGFEHLMLFTMIKIVMLDLNQNLQENYQEGVDFGQLTKLWMKNRQIKELVPIPLIPRDEADNVLKSVMLRIESDYKFNQSLSESQTLRLQQYLSYSVYGYSFFESQEFKSNGDLFLIYSWLKNSYKLQMQQNTANFLPQNQNYQFILAYDGKNFQLLTEEQQVIQNEKLSQKFKTVFEMCFNIAGIGYWMKDKTFPMLTLATQNNQSFQLLTFDLSKNLTFPELQLNTQGQFKQMDFNQEHVTLMYELDGVDKIEILNLLSKVSLCSNQLIKSQDRLPSKTDESIIFDQGSQKLLKITRNHNIQSRQDQAFDLALLINQCSQFTPLNGKLTRFHICSQDEFFKQLVQIEDRAILSVLIKNIMDNIQQRNCLPFDLLGAEQTVKLILDCMRIDPVSLFQFQTLIAKSDRALEVQKCLENSNHDQARILLDYLKFKQGHTPVITQNYQINQTIALEIFGSRKYVANKNNCEFILKSKSEILIRALVYTVDQYNSPNRSQLAKIIGTSEKSELIEADLQSIIGTLFAAQALKQVKNDKTQGYLVTQSVLFTGGIDQSFLMDQFTIPQECKFLTQIDFQESHDAEQVTVQIIHKGQNLLIDQLLSCFELQLKKTKPFLALIGQEMGLKLTRATFAVLVKLQAQQLNNFNSLVDDLQIQMVNESPETTKYLLEIILQNPEFQQLFELWEQSAKIRVWLQAKKTSIRDKIEETQQDLHLTTIISNIVDKAQFLINLESADFKPNLKLIRRSSSRHSDKQQDQEQLMRKSAAESVIACLESPILVQEIKSQVEKLCQQAVLRISGLKFIDASLEKNNSLDQVQQLVRWLNNLRTHRLDGVRGGCSRQMEVILQQVFFSILQKLINQQDLHSKEYAVVLLSALQWEFQAKDFENLVELKIFDVMYRLVTEQQDQKFTLAFKNLFYGVLARIADTNAAEFSKLKEQGTHRVTVLIPKLQKSKSVVDDNSSYQLVQSAQQAIFKLLESQNKQIQKEMIETACVFISVATVKKQVKNLLTNRLEYAQILIKLLPSLDQRQQFQVVKAVENLQVNFQFNRQDDIRFLNQLFDTAKILNFPPFVKNCLLKSINNDWIINVKLNDSCQQEELLNLLKPYLNEGELTFGTACQLKNPVILGVQDELVVLETLDCKVKLFSQTQNKVVEYEREKLTQVRHLAAPIIQATLIERIKRVDLMTLCAILMCIQGDQNNQTLQQFLSRAVVQYSPIIEDQECWYYPEELESRLFKLKQDQSVEAEILNNIRKVFCVHYQNLSRFSRDEQNFQEIQASTYSGTITETHLKKLAEKLVQFRQSFEIIDNQDYQYTPLHNKFETLEFLMWIKSAELLLDSYAGNDGEVLYQLDVVFCQIKKKNFIKGVKKTGLTSKWLKILSMQNCQYLKNFVEQICQDKSPYKPLQFNILVRLIESFELLAKDCCERVLKLILVWLPKKDKICEGLGNLVCRIIKVASSLKDQELADSVINILDEKNLDNKKYKYAKIQHELIILKTQFGIQEEQQSVFSLFETTQISKTHEFVRLEQQVSDCVEMVFKNYQKPTVNLFLENGKDKISLGQYNIMYCEGVKIEKNQQVSLICQLDNYNFKIITQPNLQNIRIFSSSMDGYYISGQGPDNKISLFLNDQLVDFNSDFSSIVSLKNFDVLVDLHNQPFKITSDLKAIQIYKSDGISQIGILNCGFILVDQGKLKYITWDQEEKQLNNFVECQYPTLKNVKIVSCSDENLAEFEINLGDKLEKFVIGFGQNFYQVHDYEVQDRNKQYRDIINKYQNVSQACRSPDGKYIVVVENVTEMYCKVLQQQGFYSQEEIMIAVKELNLQLQPEEISEQLFILTNEVTKRENKDFQEIQKDLLREKILEINLKVWKKRRLIRQIIKDNYSMIEKVVEFRARFLLPDVEFALIQKFTQILPYCYQDIKIEVCRLDQSESLFEQVFRQTNHICNIFKRKFDEMPFRVKLKGEGAADYGGPFRDLMEEVFKEISGTYFDLTSSSYAQHENLLIVPNLQADYKQLQRYRFIGYLIGFSLRNKYCIPLDFCQIFWKRILGQEIVVKDLELCDSVRYNQLTADENYFVADFGEGNQVELCNEGSQIKVNDDNRNQFIQAYIKKYLSINQVIYDNIVGGVREILGDSMLRQFNHNTVAKFACSAPQINLDELKKNISHQGSYFTDSKQTEFFQNLFWSMVTTMSNSQVGLLIKYITGSSRVDPTQKIEIDWLEPPNQDEAFNLEFMIDNPQHNKAHEQFPIAHTCNFSLDMPSYTSLDVMTQRFTTAMNECGLIDGDYVVGGEEEQWYWEEDNYYANLRQDEKIFVTNDNESSDSE